MAIEKEIIISHITSAEHPRGKALQGVTGCTFSHSSKSVPHADGERTQEADIIGAAGTLSFRNLRDADQFLRNGKADLQITGLLRGQQDPITIDIFNCKAQSMGGTTMAEAPGPFSTQQVSFQADSWEFMEGVIKG